MSRISSNLGTNPASIFASFPRSLRRELRRSLGTADPRLARLRAGAFAHQATLALETAVRTGSPVRFQMLMRNVAIDHTRGTMTVETIEADPHNTEAEIKALDLSYTDWPHGRNVQRKP